MFIIHKNVAYNISAVVCIELVGKYINLLYSSNTLSPDDITIKFDSNEEAEAFFNKEFIN